MESILKALNLLRETEANLNKMIERSLAEHNYNEVKEIAALADGVAVLLREKSPADAATQTILQVAERVKGQKSAHGVPAASRMRDTLASQPTKATPRRKSKAKAKAAPRGYPKFERDENRLVKLGWSKKNQKAYEHRVPRETLLSFIQHMTSVVNEGQVFEVESVLPAEDRNGDTIPAYQVYVTLAWLRELGAVEKKGRDGYVLRDGSLANGGVDKYWASLPIRSV